MNANIVRRYSRIAGAAVLLATISASIVIAHNAQSADRPVPAVGAGARPSGQNPQSEMDRYVKGLIYWHHHPDWGASKETPVNEDAQTPARPVGGKPAPQR